MTDEPECVSIPALDAGSGIWADTCPRRDSISLTFLRLYESESNTSYTSCFLG